jgi:hypothetical protein
MRYFASGWLVQQRRPDRSDSREYRATRISSGASLDPCNGAVLVCARSNRVLCGSLVPVSAGQLSSRRGCDRVVKTDTYEPSINASAAPPTSSYRSSASNSTGRSPPSDSWHASTALRLAELVSLTAEGRRQAALAGRSGQDGCHRSATRAQHGRTSASPMRRRPGLRRRTSKRRQSRWLNRPLQYLRHRGFGCRSRSGLGVGDHSGRATKFQRGRPITLAPSLTHYDWDFGDLGQGNSDSGNTGGLDGHRPKTV